MNCKSGGWCQQPTAALRFTGVQIGSDGFSRKIAINWAILASLTFATAKVPASVGARWHPPPTLSFIGYTAEAMGAGSRGGIGRRPLASSTKFFVYWAILLGRWGWGTLLSHRSRFRLLGYTVGFRAGSRGGKKIQTFFWKFVKNLIFKLIIYM